MDVFINWKEFQVSFGEVGSLPTYLFLNPMKIGDEVEIEMGEGRILIVRLSLIQDVREDGTRLVIFEVNGDPWYMPVTDVSSKGEPTVSPGHVGAPMPGVVVGLKVQAGNQVEEGEPVATLSAMKMETSIPAPKSGTIKRVIVMVGAKVKGGDLLMDIE
jgi:pyruvate carboxylase